MRRIACICWLRSRSIKRYTCDGQRDMPTHFRFISIITEIQDSTTKISNYMQHVLVNKVPIE